MEKAKGNKQKYQGNLKPMFGHGTLLQLLHSVSNASHTAKCTLKGAGNRTCFQGGSIKSHENGTEIKGETLELIRQIFFFISGAQLSIQIGVLLISSNVLLIKFRLGKLITKMYMK